MASHSTDGTAPVFDVEQAPSGHVSPKPSTPPLVLLDRSPTGGSLQCPVPVMDRAVALCLYTHSPPREDSDQGQGGPSRGGHHHCPLLAEEILVPPSPDGVQDPSPAAMQMGSPVTTPIDKGILYHTDLETLQLTAWKLNGVPSRTKAFLMQL